MDEKESESGHGYAHYDSGEGIDMIRAWSLSFRRVAWTGLALLLLLVPATWAGHDPFGSPAGFSITTSAFDGVAIRGITTRNSDGPGDQPVGVSGFATGDAAAFQGRVFAGFFTNTGSATQPQAISGGVRVQSFGSATGEASRIEVIRAGSTGNAEGENSAVIGAQVLMDGIATAPGASIRAVRASTFGPSGSAVAVLATTASTSGRGVDARAEATSGGTVAVRGQTNSPQGIGIHGIANNTAGLAALFDGRVQINCTEPPCLLVRGRGVADLAENMLAVGRTEAGDVVVLTTGPAGTWGVTRTTRAYDTRVAGIVSTQPRIVLDVQGQQMVPVAMTGVVTAKVTASKGSIRIGNLLTTSPIPGHLMRCSSPGRCTGAIVAKALEPLRSGRGEISVLVWRQ